jgi:hypothetical protein
LGATHDAGTRKYPDDVAGEETEDALSPSPRAATARPAGAEMIRLAEFASDAPFGPGMLLRGTNLVDRIVHAFDATGFDPARALKKTIEIETR